MRRWNWEDARSSCSRKGRCRSDDQDSRGRMGRAARCLMVLMKIYERMAASHGCSLRTRVTYQGRIVSFLNVFHQPSTVRPFSFGHDDSEVSFFSHSTTTRGLRKKRNKETQQKGLLKPKVPTLLLTTKGANTTWGQVLPPRIHQAKTHFDHIVKISNGFYFVKVH